MKDYIKRMCDESVEIDAIIEIFNKRIDKLYTYINDIDDKCTGFKDLSKKEQKLMVKQLEKMQKVSTLLAEYRDIVDQRIGINMQK